MQKKISCVFIVLFTVSFIASFAQSEKINWSPDGKGYVEFKRGEFIKIDPRDGSQSVIFSKAQLTPKGSSISLAPQSFEYSNDGKQVLLFTNTAKVWRYKTRGDYWVMDVASGNLRQIGKTVPAQSLKFAKFSPDGRYVGFVSDNNIHIEDLSNNISKRLTNDGTRKMINGTFDWVYEEEFGCRDGFRWGNDSKQIAYWQVDATKTRDYYMLNTTDSNYSKVIPVEYPKVGESPSSVRIGVVNISNGFTRWMNIAGNPEQHYIPRMEWSGPNEIVVQQLDRKQQESKLIYCKTTDGSSYTFWAEGDKAWVDLNTSDPKGWNWVNNGADFIWVSEQDGWRHVYKISRDGKTKELLTKGKYDIAEIIRIDEAGNNIYFTASPKNPTQRYLYKVRINDAKEDPELVTDDKFKGMHNYDISPNGKTALHRFSNHNTMPVGEWVGLPDGKPLSKKDAIENNIKTDPNVNVEYFQVITEDGVSLDAWINKPTNFDPNKKYPSIFYVYGEPAASTVEDAYGNHQNFLYAEDIQADGYIQVGIDNRGTPSLKGAAWRKSIYRKIGDINIKDMAQGAKKILEKSYFDKDRVAVWGWSGGGSSTLNLLFRYPEIFQTGVAVAAVANQLFYDNIYQERYMGIPQENKIDFINGSPASHAKGLKGNLLYIHGTGDDNVHYSNAEFLINELIKHNKQFSLMSYPNRSHSISEGEGTFQHLSTLYTNFMRMHNPPGAKNK